MNLFTRKKVGVTKEEKTLSYFKFFERDLATVPEEKLRLIENPSEIPAVQFEDRNIFLAGENENFCKIGYGVMDDGTGFVANETYMPKVTSEMLDWWFAWHSVGSDLRYKIWDSEDHYFAKADKVDYVCDPKVPVKEKTWGVRHHIIEDIGNGPSFLIISFKRPADFGLDEKIIGTEKCASLVCGIGEGDCPAAMIHKWYPYENGVMFCSRFWIGFAEKNGKFFKVIPDGVKIPVEVPRGLYAHNIKEFSNLAAILPEVYAENKNNF